MLQTYQNLSNSSIYLIYLLISRNKMFTFAKKNKNSKWQLTEHLQ